jgi:hypothetical protein
MELEVSGLVPLLLLLTAGTDMSNLQRVYTNMLRALLQVHHNTQLIVLT